EVYLASVFVTDVARTGNDENLRHRYSTCSGCFALNVPAHRNESGYLRTSSKTVSIATLHQPTSPYLRPPLPAGEGTRSGGLRGAGLRLPSPAGRRCRAAADEGGGGASASTAPHRAFGPTPQAGFPPLPAGEGTRSGGLRGAGLRLPSPAGRRCRAAADEGGAGPRPVPPLTGPSARPRKRGSPRSRRERERAAADEGHSCRRDCSLIRLQGLRSHLVGAEYLGDSFNNSLQAMEDLVIGDSDHPQPKALEPGFPATITGPSVGMAVAVNLQDQTRGMTVEVHDVRSDHHLPRKLPTRQATVAESVPD